MGKHAILWIAGLALTALLIAGFLAVFERKVVDVPLPPRGEAVYNPLYTLKIALQKDGQRVESRPHLLDAKHALGAHDTVVLLADPARLSPRENETLLTHIARGGHVVVRASTAKQLDSFSPLLARFGVGKHVDSDGECLPVQPPSGHKAGEITYEVFCGDRFAMQADATPLFAWRDAEGVAFARFAHAQGSLDVVASLGAARYVAIQENAMLVRQLLQPNWNRGTFHLIYASEMPSLWRLLADNAWRAIVVLALCIAAWVWMRTQRFGPRLPSPPDARRSLLEHVQATGDHLYRYGRAHLLHSALRAHVLARLRRKDAVAAALTGQPQVDAIAARTGLPPADIADALHSPRPYDAKDFRHRIARLIDLGRHT